jgi:hypothetical protein
MESGESVKLNNVFMTAAVPADTTVTMSTSYPSALSVQPTVTIAAGASQRSFVLTANVVSVPTKVQVTATYGGVSTSQIVTVNPPKTSATLSFIGVYAPTMKTGDSVKWNNVFMTGVVSADTTVTMSTSNPSVLSVQPTVTIAAGASQNSFVLTANRVNVPTKVTVTATYGGVSTSQIVTVNPI